MLIAQNPQAIIYVRVSTDHQNTESQIGAIEKRAHERGYEIIDVIEEKLSGATAMDLRPGIKRLRDHIKKGVRNVLVYDVSRIGRDLFESIKLIRELTFNKVNVHITDLALNTIENGAENPNTTLMINMMLSMAEYQRQQIRSKVLLGIANYRKNNNKWGRGKGTKITPQQIKEKYKGVIKDLTNNPDWSMRLIARNRGVSAMTVARIRQLLKES